MCITKIWSYKIPKEGAIRYKFVRINGNGTMQTYCDWNADKVLSYRIGKTTARHCEYGKELVINKNSGIHVCKTRLDATKFVIENDWWYNNSRIALIKMKCNGFIAGGFNTQSDARIPQEIWEQVIVLDSIEYTREDAEKYVKKYDGKKSVKKS
jgi:hypothetical protein